MLVTAAILAASCNPLDTEWDPFSILDPSQGGFGGPGGAMISVTPADCPIDTSIEGYAGQTVLYVLITTNVLPEQSGGTFVLFVHSSYFYGNNTIRT